MNTKTNNIETKKTDFQDAITKIESSLAEYKTSFPKNFGDMFRSRLKVLCMVYAGYCILSAVAFAAFDNLMKAFFVSLPMFFAGILLSYKPKEIDSDNIKSMRAKLTPLEEYSDVKKYAEGLDEEVTRAAAQKASYKVKNNIILYLFIGVLATMLTVSFVHDNTFLRDDLENIHRNDNCGIFTRAAEFFQLEPKKPFVEILPYNHGEAPLTLPFYIVNINTGKDNKAGDCLAALRFAAPEIRGSNPGERYRIIITDAKGKPSTISFPYTVGEPYGQKRIAKDEITALNICNYLFLHSEKLKYKVEKE